MGSVIKTCVPNEPERDMKEWQNTQPMEQKQNPIDSGGERAIEPTYTSTTQMEITGIAGAAITLCDIEGTRQSETSPTQTQNDSNPEMCHGSPQCTSQIAPSSDVPNTEGVALTAESGGSGAAFQYPIDEPQVSPELNRILSGVEERTDTRPVSNDGTHSASGLSISPSAGDSKSKSSPLSIKQIAKTVKDAYDIAETPMAADGPNLVWKGSVDQMSENYVRRTSAHMQAEMHRLSKNINGDSRVTVTALDNHDDSDSETDLDDELDPSAGVFRMQSAAKWTAKDIESTKNDMAQQLVYLQTRHSLKSNVGH